MSPKLGVLPSCGSYKVTFKFIFIENKEFKRTFCLHYCHIYLLLVPGRSRKLVNNKASERESSQSCSAATLDGRVVLRIVKQPESQHRARYLTEGSRGSVKDRIGTGFPTVKLEGCAVPIGMFGAAREPGQLVANSLPSSYLMRA